MDLCDGRGPLPLTPLPLSCLLVRLSTGKGTVWAQAWRLVPLSLPQLVASTQSVGLP